MPALDLLARATDPAALDEEVGWLVLGQCYFDADDVVWSENLSTLTIPLSCEEDPALGSAQARQIVFREVASFEMHEEFRVERNHLGLEYRPDEGVVDITGFPAASIRLRVRSLDVSVYGRRGAAPILRSPWA